jgi:hypothetical protein
MDDDANQAYFKVHGWPVHISGTLKTLSELDKGELLMLASKYATVLQVEFGQITIPPKRGVPETVEPVLDAPEPVKKPRARKKPKRKSRATHR